MFDDVRLKLCQPRYLRVSRSFPPDPNIAQIMTWFAVLFLYPPGCGGNINPTVGTNLYNSGFCRRSCTRSLEALNESFLNNEEDVENDFPDILSPMSSKRLKVSDLNISR